MFAALRTILHDEGFATGQGDEGGFAPSLASNEAAVEVILRAIEKAGYKPGDEVGDRPRSRASSELVEPGTGGDGTATRYVLAKEGRTLDSGELVDLWADWVARYPIVSIEDGLAEDDWAGWTHCSPSASARRSSSSATTCWSRTSTRIRRAIDERAANAVLIKLNQIGTLTETIDAIELARRAGWSAVVSHRSGETEDTTISDLVVAMGTGPDQDGRAVALRAGGQVQPPAPDRRRAGRRRALPRPRGPVRRGSPRGAGALTPMGRRRRRRSPTGAA